MGTGPDGPCRGFRNLGPKIVLRFFRPCSPCEVGGWGGRGTVTPHAGAQAHWRNPEFYCRVQSIRVAKVDPLRLIWLCRD